MVNKNSAEYIEELENKIVDLSLKLKGKSNQLKNIENENYERIRKLVHNLKQLHQNQIHHSLGRQS